MTIHERTVAPRVSVIIPAFNVPPKIIEESLESLMKQTFQDFECIVVDESTDVISAQACQKMCDRDVRFRHVCPDSRLGLAASLNLGISLSRGDLIARFDSDDVCSPIRLSEQVRFMDLNPKVGVLGSSINIIDLEGRKKGERKYPCLFQDIEKRMQFINAMAHPTVMFRADIVKRHGSYDPAFRYCEDLELWLRWLNSGILFANLPNNLIDYRQHHTGRPASHWSFNLRARTKNFSKNLIFRRILGISCIFVWTMLPASAREMIFKVFIIKIKK